MLFGRAPWLEIPGLLCLGVCRNYQTREMISQGLRYGYSRTFPRKQWKTGQQHRGQSGQQGTVIYIFEAYQKSPQYIRMEALNLLREYRQVHTPNKAL